MMLLRHTLLYLPAQLIGPLFQLISVIVWTHVVDEHTLGVITLVTATHELLQIAFLAWWSQYALRFLGRYRSEGDPLPFYRTENVVLLLSCIIQSLAVVAVLLLVIAPDANAGLLAIDPSSAGALALRAVTGRLTTDQRNLLGSFLSASAVNTCVPSIRSLGAIVTGTSNSGAKFCRT